MKYLSAERVPHTEVEKHFLKDTSCRLRVSLYAELCLSSNDTIYVNSEGRD